MATERSPKDLWGGMATGWILSWGGIGLLLDWAAGTGRVFTAIGMVAGAVGATYLVWFRYGRGHEPRP
jgi:CHASE2 domain-containing sensor protein